MNLFAKAVFSAAIIGAALTGCGEEKSKELKLGAIAGPEAQIAQEAAKVAKEKYGLTVKVVEFSDYATPNVALNDGSIDLNAFQHKPYLDQQIKDRGFKLVAVGNTFVYPIAGFSKKIKNISELKDGAQIAVPNDPSNLGRSLLLLAKQGLITLKDGAGLNSTKLDIASNPRNFNIVELDAAQLTHALDDADIAIINNTYAGQANLQVGRDSLFVESKESPFVNLIVARENNKDDEAVKTFVKAFQDDAVYKKAVELFQGGVVKGW